MEIFNLINNGIASIVNEMQPVLSFLLLAILVGLVYVITPMLLMVLVLEIKQQIRGKDIDPDSLKQKSLNDSQIDIENKAKYIHNRDMYDRKQLDQKHDKNDWHKVKKELQNKRVLSQ